MDVVYPDAKVIKLYYIMLQRISLCIHHLFYDIVYDKTQIIRHVIQL